MCLFLFCHDCFVTDVSPLFGVEGEAIHCIFVTDRYRDGSVYPVRHPDVCWVLALSFFCKWKRGTPKRVSSYQHILENSRVLFVAVFFSFTREEARRVRLLLLSKIAKLRSLLLLVALFSVPLARGLVAWFVLKGKKLVVVCLLQQAFFCSTLLYDLVNGRDADFVFGSKFFYDSLFITPLAPLVKNFPPLILIHFGVSFFRWLWFHDVWLMFVLFLGLFQNID